jgi:DNA-directed RNA polymerase subunit RPC12/RpoP
MIVYCPICHTQILISKDDKEIHCPHCDWVIKLEEKEE